MTTAYTWDAATKTVSYSYPWGEVVKVDWLKFYARFFMIGHLHWEGRYRSVLDRRPGALTRYFLKCDGFGKHESIMDFFRRTGTDYDWSHIRDTSYPTALEIARELSTEFWDKDFEEMADQVIKWAASVGKTPPEFLYD